MQVHRNKWRRNTKTENQKQKKYTDREQMEKKYTDRETNGGEIQRQLV